MLKSTDVLSEQADPALTYLLGTESYQIEISFSGLEKDSQRHTKNRFSKLFNFVPEKTSLWLNMPCQCNSITLTSRILNPISSYVENETRTRKTFKSFKRSAMRWKERKYSYKIELVLLDHTLNISYSYLPYCSVFQI